MYLGTQLHLRKRFPTYQKTERTVCTRLPKAPARITISKSRTSSQISKCQKNILMRARSAEGVGVGVAVPPGADSAGEACARWSEESVAEGVSVKVLTGVVVAKELCVTPSDGGVAVGVGVGAAAALPGGTCPEGGG